MALDETTLTQAMKASLKEVWKEKGRGDLPDTGEEDREILFLAIARAVVKQLKAGLLEEDAHKHTATCEVTISPANGTYTHTHQAKCEVTVAPYKHRHKSSTS